MLILKLIRYVFHRMLVLSGAAALTLAFFLVLPLIQTLSKPPRTDLVVHAVDSVIEPPPPPPVEEEPEKEEEPEEEPPELQEEQQELLDLEQLELALNPGFAEGLLAGDFAVDLGAAASNEDDVEALFSMSDLDQKPRAVYQPSPILDAKMRKRTPGKVVVICIVDERGRVEDPLVQSSSDPIFEKAALAAVKQWRFEPGKRNGKPVRFRVRQPFVFPEG